MKTSSFQTTAVNRANPDFKGASVQPKDCTLVIATRHRAQILEKLLSSVCPLAFGEVVVVDSCPIDSVKVIVGRHPVTYLLEREKGASRARNRGARHATTPFIVFLEDDAVPLSGWADALLREFNDPEVGAVIARVTLPPDVTDPEFIELNRNAGYLHQGDIKKIVSLSTKDWFTAINFGGVSLGGLMAMRRCVFSPWSGFDNRIGAGTVLNGGDEPRAFSDIVAAGWKLVYTPDAVVQHPAQPRTLEEMQNLVLDRVTAATAYLIMLFREDRAHRKEILRYVFGKILNGTREFSPTRVSGLSRLRFFRARLRGIPVYFRVRRQPLQSRCSE